MNYQPVIKWTGSKRYLSEQILSYFPNEINTYYEPFCGGASILRSLLNSNIKVKNYVCSDINKHLIKLWSRIKDQPQTLSDDYKNLWQELNKFDDITYKKQFYNKVRSDFNINHDASKFLFLSRTATNGLIRFNSKGEFNSSFHLTRPGINPNTLKNIIFEWSQLLNDYSVNFICCSYENITPQENDFIYLDPPYANTDTMYFGEINLDELWNYIRNLKCDYLLSFNGKTNKIDNTYNVPKDIYNKHIYLDSGNSGFKKLQQDIVKVQESLYLKNII